MKEQIVEESIIGMTMEAQAMANIRERRKRRTQSAIFDGSEQKRTQVLEKVEVKNKEDQIDLTLQQEETQKEQYTEVEDEMEILDAYIDPLDVKAQLKKSRLIEEIESEKQKIKCKFLFKYGRQESDPFKLWS